MANARSFIGELKRRNVLRACAFYAAAAWALAQGVSQLSPAFGLPDWTTRWFVIACIIGFPFWTAFAWFYEWTPHGLKRESEVERDQSITRSTGRKLNFWIIGALAVAVVLLLTNSLVWHKGAGFQPADAAFNPPADSIVVLPFANLSDDPGQKYFSNGITEELTGALGQNTGLAVIAWDTASRFADSKQTPAEIGKALNVAHILDGTIQREGDTVRVSVELVDSVTGRELWSEHYDDSFKNIFAVQDRISAAIAQALKVKFAGMQAAPTLNPQAHELYLKGLASMARFTAAGAQAAQDYFQQTLKLDSNYADAWAGLAHSYLQLSEVSTLPLKEALPRTRAAAEKALSLDSRNVNAFVALGLADANDNRIAEAKTEFERALAIDPSNAGAHMNFGLVLPLKQALVQEQEAARLDPDDTLAQNNLAVLYQDLGDWPQMVAALQALNKLSPHEIDAAFGFALAYTQMKRGEDAVKAFDLVQPATALDKQLVDAGRLTYQALLQPSLRPEALAALDTLRHVDLSPFAQSDLLQLYLALGEKDTALQMLTGNCTANPIGCSDLKVNPVFAPLRGDLRFERLSKQYATLTSQ
ncbi:MAG: Adenylate cyclase [Rhodanobacteraceae bacterium]|nr:MAG: Adenylate cyclase [Rhodanobacteraceae bacterium]